MSEVPVNRVLIDAAEEEEMRSLGAPIRCCGYWPECSHVLAWYEEWRKTVPAPAPSAGNEQ